jgi:hypothetical protein
MRRKKISSNESNKNGNFISLQTFRPHFKSAIKNTNALIENRKNNFLNSNRKAQKGNSGDFQRLVISKMK